MASGLKMVVPSATGRWSSASVSRFRLGFPLGSGAVDAALGVSVGFLYYHP